MNKTTYTYASWEAGLPDPPTFKREEFKHTIKSIGVAGNDDLYEMNTQSGSQASSIQCIC